MPLYNFSYCNGGRTLFDDEEEDILLSNSVWWRIPIGNNCCCCELWIEEWLRGGGGCNTGCCCEWWIKGIEDTCNGGSVIFGTGPARGELGNDNECWKCCCGLICMLWLLLEFCWCCCWTGELGAEGGRTWLDKWLLLLLLLSPLLLRWCVISELLLILVLIFIFINSACSKWVSKLPPVLIETASEERWIVFVVPQLPLGGIESPCLVNPSESVKLPAVRPSFGWPRRSLSNSFSRCNSCHLKQSEKIENMRFFLLGSEW